MYLKRLEIQGFKSFADRLSLEFNRGISAVVGPNGSGKSNISDAVRWALGEQSIKSLRGAKLEDVIFSGTINRRPLNFAEVSLVIDNQDLKIPVEFSEIEVTRRVYRSGESQFFINKSPVRLRDIHELFYDTGVGREGYSIIGQGKIDEILSVKSEDRRNLFEEAAGITKYKTKRGEAENRLEREKQNLIRVDDILAELDAQLEPLFVQSERAKVFLRLNDRLKLVELNGYLLQSARLKAEIVKHQENIDNANESIKNENDNRAENAEEKQRLGEEVSLSDEKAAGIHERILEAKLEAEKSESRAKLSGQKIQFYKDEIARLEGEITRVRAAAAENKALREGFAKKLDENSGERRAIDGAAANAAAELELLEKALNDARAEHDRYSGEHLSGINRRSELQLGIKESEAAYSRLEERKEQLDDERARLAEKKAEAYESIKACESTILDNKRLAAKLADELALISEAAASLAKAAVESGKRLNAAKREQFESFSRKKLLEELEHSHEGYQHSVKRVLEQRDKHKLNGICGAVAGLITTDSRYETAIETALGAALQNIVVDSEADAKAAINFLKASDGGRATFLPLSAVKPQSFGKERDSVLSAKGVIGAADELVIRKPEYDALVSSLLGRVVVLENIDDAIAFCMQTGYRYKAVTLGGELFSAGGAITGGSKGRGASLLGRAREINELGERLKVLASSLAEFEAEAGEAEAKRSAAVERTGKLNFRIREIEMSDIAEVSKLNGLKAQLAELEQSAAYIGMEEVSVMERLTELNKRIREQTRAQDELLAEIDGILETIGRHRQDIKESQKLLEQKQKEVTALKIKQSVLKEAASAIEESVTRTDAAISAQNREIDEAYVSIDSQSYQIKLQEAEISAAKAEIEVLAGSLEENEALLLAEASAKNELTARLDELAAADTSSYETLGRLTNELTRYELKKEQLEQEIKKLSDDIWDKYNLTHNQILSPEYEKLDMSLSALAKEEAALKNEIKSLGPINISAIEEYRAVSERHAFMKKQRDDIVDAEAKLRDIIQDLSELMERQFMERFEQISESFNIVFAEMFQGGRAILRLTDPGSPLESGIDIISQPPGKNLQNMLLFSGGERALTAIALLFGILRLKPSPFCILDEIEAALDDSNVKRFADYIKNFSKETQFILITHRKGTMETADVLYGVTMQELGVSKLVSVRLSGGPNGEVDGDI